MHSLGQDLRFAFRQLRKSPSFTLVAVLTLALGIGANTAIFSIVNTLLLKPLPVPQAGQITMMAGRQGTGALQNSFSWPEFRALRELDRRSFSDVFAYGLGLDGFAVNGTQPERITTSFVTGNFFTGLGLKPALGRLFLASEGEVFGRDPVMVLGYDFWLQKFQGDPNIVGRKVTVDGQPLTVVGVAPKGFRGLQPVLDIQAYLPFSETPIGGTPANDLNNWQNRGLLVFGRLRQQSSLKEAAAELNRAAQTLKREHPDVENRLSLTVLPEPALRFNTGDPRVTLLMGALFLGLAALVLLLACMNVANLILVRATVREREMAIRSALGASRSRLLRQLVTESVTLALIGGIFGVTLGMWASGLLGGINPRTDIPVTFAVDFDWRLLSYSLAAALLAGIVVGVLPALRSAKSDVNAVLHEGGRTVVAGRHWFRDTLVVLQVASSLVLLVVTGLFVRSLSAMQTMDFGFNPDHVLNATIDPNEIGENPEQTRDLARSILSRLHQLGGVRYVSHANLVPMGYVNNGGDTVSIEGAPPPADPSSLAVGTNVVSPEYFQVMGIPVLRGREFTDADDEHGKDVAVIDEVMAKMYWPNQDPIGRVFRMKSERDRKLEVVGVVPDVVFQLFIGGKHQPFVYIPYAQHYKGNTFMVFQLRTAGDPPVDPMTLAPAVEEAIHGLSPQLPVFDVNSMRDSLYTLNGLMLFQIAASLAAAMGTLGFTLAIVGLYGVISYAVSQRTHEIGLRMAFGASRKHVFEMVYRHAVVIIATGLGIGLALALLVSRIAGSLVVVSAYDPVTYVAVTSSLCLVALGACYLPARQAMRVEPLTALRHD